MKRHGLTTLLLAVLVLLIFNYTASCATNAAFSLSIEPVKDVVKVGSPIRITIVKTNMSNHAISNSRTSNPAEYYKFEVTDQQNRPAAEKNLLKQMKAGQAANKRYSGSVILGNLQPGETSKDTVEISAYHDVSRPGMYSIRVKQTDPETKVEVVSNTITVTVIP